MRAVVVICCMLIAMPVLGEIFRFKQPEAVPADGWEFTVNGKTEGGVKFEPCGANQLWCAETPRSYTEPYCHSLFAVEGMYRTEAANGQHCHPLADSCACDLNGNGAVGLGDIMLALHSGDLSIVSTCIDQLGTVANC